MKATGFIFPIICFLMAAGLAFYWALEHQASARLEQENSAMRLQLSRTDSLPTESQHPSDHPARANGLTARAGDSSGARVRSEEPAKELERLRREVEALRQQSQQIEILRADTRQARADQEAARSNSSRRQISPGAATGNELEIVRADYWTDKTNMDVSAELTDRIRGDKLKAIASNNLKGDPEFGQVKHLTIVYRVGGVMRTNEFREGEIVVLPSE